MPSYSYIQTFFINPEAVDNSPNVMIRNVELFFKSKPAASNISGATKPGVVVSICKTSADTPVTDPDSIIPNSITRLSYDEINAISNATLGTTFRFRAPIQCETGKTYGIVVEMEDPAYDLWTNVTGANLMTDVGPSNTASAGSGANFRGMLYRSGPTSSPGGTINTQSSAPTQFTPYADRDLKFSVKISKFTIPDNKRISIDVVNKSYEFFTITSRSGTFTGGEFVYQNDANKTGAITVSTTSLEIVGTGTTFSALTPGQYIVFTVNSKINVLKITNIFNDTLLSVEYFPSDNGTVSFKVPPVGKLYYSNYVDNIVYLVDSNASSSTFKFTAGQAIIGASSGATAAILSVDKVSVDSFVPRFKIGNPAFVDTVINYQFSFYTKDGSNWINPTAQSLDNDKLNTVKDYDAYVHSRSLEVNDSGYGLSTSKSAVANITFTYETSKTYTYQAPFVDGSQLDMFVQRYDISNTSTQYVTKTDASGNSYVYDTEADRSGLSNSKYISKKITFSANRAAEDVVVYSTMYRPKGSEVKIYAKIHNTFDDQQFDDKNWTPLELKSNADLYSLSADDLIEYQFGLPSTPETTQVLTGNFTTQLGNTIIGTTIDHSTSGTNAITVNSPVLVYDRLLPDNKEVYIVTAANSSTITLNRPISNNNLVSSSGGAFGYIKLAPLTYPYSAFNNSMNDNVSRYISSSLIEFDAFNSIQVKIVMNAENTYDVPKIDTIQVVGVSA